MHTFVIAFIFLIVLAGTAQGQDAHANDFAWLAENRLRVLQLFELRDSDPELNDRAAVTGDLAIRVGERLFFDRALSGNGNLSCGNCHQPDRLWTDGLPTASGTEQLAFNTPTLIGVARQKWLFWDGRVVGLAHQATFPMISPAEMATKPAKLVDLIRSDVSYSEAYSHYFGDLPAPCNVDLDPSCTAPQSEVVKNVAKLIASFVAAIPSPETLFDRFLSALRQNGTIPFTATQLRGLKLFVEKGNCVACHSGSDLTDGQFHNVLVPSAEGPSVYAQGRYGGIRTAKRQMAEIYNGDGGFDQFARQEIGRARADSSTYAAFKTPTLRGLRCTAPYMHNGRYTSIELVIEHYSTFKDVMLPDHFDDPLLIPRDFDPDDKLALVEFLRSISPDQPECVGGSGISSRASSRNEMSISE